MPVLFALLALAVLAGATEYNVSTSSQLSTALTQIASGDTVSLAPGDYSGNFTATQPILLRSQDPQAQAVLTGGSSFYCLTAYDTGPGTALEDLLFRPASGLALFLSDHTFVQARRCRFESMSGIEDEWAMVHVDYPAGLLAQDCEFVGDAQSAVGAIRSYGEVALVGCLFGAFAAQEPVVYRIAGAPLRLVDCRFIGNQVEHNPLVYGAGILLGCEFSASEGQSLLGPSSNLGGFALEDCQITGNRMERLATQIARLDRCVVTDNQAEGSLLVLLGSDVSVNGTLLARNQAASLIRGSNLALTRCTLADNRCADGLFGTYPGMRLDQCALLANEAPSLETDWLVDSVRNTLVWANQWGDWTGALEPFAGQHGNLEANPLLVDLEAGDFRPTLASPLCAENNPAGQRLGALDPVDLPAAPVARFRATPRHGAFPLAVEFQALDTLAATGWQWDLDDDGDVDASGPVFRATLPQRGIYPLRLHAFAETETRQHALADAVRVGGRTQFLSLGQDLSEHVDQSLPGDTLVLANGEWDLGNADLRRAGITLRGESHEARFVLDFWSTLDLSSDLPLRLERFVLAAAGQENALAVRHGDLAMDDVRIEGELPLSLSECGRVSLHDVRFSGARPSIRQYGGRVEVSGGSLPPASDMAWISTNGGEILLRECQLESPGQLVDGSDVQLRMEDCRLTGDVRLHLTDSGVGLAGCILRDVPGLVSPGSSGDSLAVVSSTLLDCGPAMLGGPWGVLQLDHSIVVGSSRSLLDPSISPDPLLAGVSDTDLWAYDGDPWSPPALAPFEDAAGNIQAYPRFCDPAVGILDLAEDSPCLLDVGSGEVMGARPVGCAEHVPAVRMAVSPTHGPAPLLSGFRDISLGEFQDRLWDFDGNGSWDEVSTNASWLFMAPGVYRPVLRRTGPGGGFEGQGPPVVAGGDRHVRVPEDHATLAEALAYVASSDVVEVGAGLWPAQDLLVPAGVRVEGPAHDGQPVAVLDGQGAGHVLRAELSMDPLLLANLELRGATDGALILLEYEGEDGFVQVEDCRFADNHSSGWGGAVVAPQEGSLVLRDCSFEDNSGTVGGAVSAWNLYAQRCRFRGNRSFSEGGAIVGQGDVILRDCVFEENHAQTQGGAVTLYVGSSPTVPAQVDSCLFIRNSAGATGSSLNTYNSLLLRRDTFYGDSSSGGSAIKCYGNTLLMDHTLISHGRRGTPVDSWANSQIISCCDIWGNADGDWVGDISSYAEINGNTSVDPYYCDPAAGDFALAELSPLRPPDSACGWVGGVFVDCGVMEVEEPALLPRRATLSPAFPNPFNPSTTLWFQLPEPCRARLSVYNLAGQEVARLVDGLLPAGAHQRVFHSGGLASGMYFARLNAGGQVEDRKLLLVK